LAKRIIACLDIMNGRTVKGVNFLELKDAGDPVELGKIYSEQGIDELVFLDITATHEKRKTLNDLAKAVAAQLNIPFTIGGGVSSLDDARVLLESGADKISINSAAVKNPEIINQLSLEFGSQFVVVAIDGRMNDFREWEVYIGGGRIPTGISMFDWAKQVTDRGAGEILFTSMNHDGVKTGFAVEATKKIAELVPVPVIASGGAGNMDHFADVFHHGKADAALAASIFHYKEIEIKELKKYLAEKGIPIRL
ncbi:MAG: imidazole glycerol phosphate synthase subunit HisF, partial [Saprospiraceae bacterium]|nr:imidazole glycerol phosphate synthase subunit HisF [Saprospiraceae bacterium]